MKTHQHVNRTHERDILRTCMTVSGSEIGVIIVDDQCGTFSHRRVLRAIAKGHLQEHKVATNAFVVSEENKER